MPKLEHTDRDTLRNLLVNFLYYYNCTEKLESVSSKLKHQKHAKKPVIDPPADAGEDDVSVSDELAAAKVLQAIDDGAYTVHFVLQQLRNGYKIVDLFEGYSLDPEEEARRIKISICKFIRLYSQAIDAIDELHLKNHISYWLIISTILETGLIEELDSLFIEIN